MVSNNSFKENLMAASSTLHRNGLIVFTLSILLFCYYIVINVLEAMNVANVSYFREQTTVFALALYLILLVITIVKLIKIKFKIRSFYFYSFIILMSFTILVFLF